jgi:RNA polymerase sigma-70 factor (ECF subfamily)
MCADWAEADDLAQETFVAAWSHIGSFRADQSLRSWLYRIAYRKFLAGRRAATRRRSRDIVASETILNAETPTVDMSAHIDLARALRELNPDQRAAVALCLGAGLSHREAAEALGMPLGTVKSHVERGRLKLMTLLGLPQ